MKSQDFESNQSKQYAPKRLYVDDFKINKYPFEVVETRERYFEIHIWQHPGIPFEVCHHEIRVALLRIFGKKTSAFELIYRDEDKISHKLKIAGKVQQVNSFMITVKPPICHIYNREDLGRQLANVLSDYT